ncbi:MAG: CotH kinase family protein [Saprospiraceae bacterium]|nr:CotH kinase family protein [Saprospiraceae bacterium]
MRSEFILLSVLLVLSRTVIAQVEVVSSPLPLLLIDTEGRLIQDEPKIDATLKVIDNGPGKINHVTDQPNGYSGRIGIEYRGSSSQNFPKKPYGFETRDATGEDMNVSLLVTYILAGQIMEYAPRVRMVEVILNGNYEGVYLLTEKIKRDNDRVDIDKLDPEDVTGDAVTGGYIMKLDKQTGSSPNASWTSDYPPYPGAWQRVLVQLEYPESEDITFQQIDYIRQHMQKVENIIAAPSYNHPKNGFRKYIDTASLMDFIILNELGKNPDANLGYGNVDYCTGPSPEGLVIRLFNSVCNGDGWVVHFWWKRFLQDETFYRSLKLRWKELRKTSLSNQNIQTVTDSLIALLEPVQQRNFQRWPVLGQYVWPNSFIGQTWQQETWFFKDWVTKRLAYLDLVWEITDLPPVPQTIAITSLKPNPAENQLEVTVSSPIPASAVMHLTDAVGKTWQVSFEKDTPSSATLDVSYIPPGIYILAITDGTTTSTAKFMKK